jgi:CRISPR/Cas system-associated exonuclease Cas4 (RecB family)|tara:strand:- start:4227 stop:4676 length:450 start_codon:yes stop_codon:yes gene_type:complete
MEVLLEKGTPDLLTEGFDQKLIDAAQNSIGAFELWLERHEVEPLYIEEVLVSDTYELGGTADLIATVDGVVEVIDFKTGTKLNKHKLQVAAYFMLAQDAGIHVDQCRMVYGHRNKKSGDNQLQEVIVYKDEIEELWNCIRAAKYLFERV